MLGIISAAVMLCVTLVCSAPADSAPPVQSISTQAAYESWLAWYHAKPLAQADSCGPRFRQLMAAVDGDLYFLKGLDDTSPQVRELSQQGLVRLSTQRSMVELRKRLDSQRAREVLAAIATARTTTFTASSDSDDNVSGPRVRRPASGAWTEPPHLWPPLNGVVPFGGLLSKALAGRETQQALKQLGDVDRTETAEPWNLMKRWATAYQRSTFSKNSAQKLLALVTQSPQFSLLDGVDREQLRQALEQHIGHATAPPNSDDSASPWRFATLRPRIELERQMDGCPTTNSRHQATQRLRTVTEPAAASESLPAKDSPFAQAEYDGFFSSETSRCPADELTGDAFSATWVHCPLNESKALAAGTYKLLLTFQSSPNVTFGFDAATLRRPTIGAIVFRVQAPSEDKAEVAALAEKPQGWPEAWQILLVAISDSGNSWDDLCVPAPSTVAARTAFMATTPVVNTHIGISR